MGEGGCCHEVMMVEADFCNLRKCVYFLKTTQCILNLNILTLHFASDNVDNIQCLFVIIQFSPDTSNAKVFRLILLSWR